MNTFIDAIEFANRHPVCFAATIDGDRPRVRGLSMLRADESGFYFASQPQKNIIRQLRVNPNIEICFYRQGDARADSEMLRISGRARFVDDERNAERSGGRREGSAGQEEGACYRAPVLFKIIAGEAYAWKSSDGLAAARTLLFDISDAAQGPHGDDFLSFTEKEYSYHLDMKNIIYCSSSGKHTIIHTENRDYEVARLLKAIRQMLPPHRFMRIQKQHVVNLAYIDRIEYLEGGRYIAYLNDSDDTVLPVGRAHVAPLKEKIARRVPFVP